MPKSVIRFCLALIASAAWGQTSQATLQGLVQDPSGAAVPSANVEVTNTATGVANRVRTNEQGWFVVPYLLPGEYSVGVEKQGFRRFTQAGIVLHLDQKYSLNVQLAVGDLATQVEVRSTAPPLDTLNGTLAVTMDNKSITDLPLSGGRDVRTLALLMPGVTPGTGSAGAGIDFSPWIGGGRNATSEVRVDGTGTSTPDPSPGAMGTGGSMPNVDAVLELTVLTNALAAEYGRSGGGAILVASKQGTNKVHGTAFEFFRNELLKANDFFSNRAGAAKAPFTNNQFGFSLGGPVYIPRVYNGRNRTFFLVDLQKIIAETPTTFIGTVPIAAWKNGDFSNLRNASGTMLSIFDPLTYTTGASSRLQFAGNQIPPSRFDPVATKLMTYYPEPNTTPVNQYTQINNFFNSQTTQGRTYNFTARLDQNFSSFWRSFWRITKYRTETKPPNVFGNPGTPMGRGDSIVPKVGFTWDNTVTLTPTTIVSLSYGLSRFNNSLFPPSKGFDLTTLGFPQYFQAQAAKDMYTRFPRFDITGLTSLGQQTAAGIGYVPTSHNFTSSLTKVFTRHVLKTGFEYRKLLLNFWQEQTPAGQFSYTVAWTQRDPVSGNITQGFGLASLLLGYTQGGSQQNTLAQALASSYFAGYVQDDFRVSRSLTINIGIRYEVDLPRTERYNRLSWFDANARSPIAGMVPGFDDLRGAMYFATPDHRRQTPTDANNFSPRFGFAKRYGNKTVVRGAYALMYAPSLMQAAYHNSGFQGFRCSTSMITTLDSGRSLAATLRDPYPSGFCATLGAIQGPTSGTNTGLGLTIGESWFPDYVNATVQQWNLNVQRLLPGRITVEIGYLGNKGNHVTNGETLAYNQLRTEYASLGNQLNVMVPNPFYGVITDSTSTLSRATVQRRQLLRPYPQYSAVNSIMRPTGNSLYHGGTLRVEKRFARGFSFLVSYTKAKLIDDSGWGNTLSAQNTNTTRQNVYDLHSDRAVSEEDVAQRLVVSFNYDLPFGRGRRFMARAPLPVQLVAGGWQVNGIMTMQSGLPVPMYSAVNQIGLNNQSARPNNNGTSAKKSGGTKDARMKAWFDTSVFSIASPYIFGTAPRVLPDVRNPGIRNFDLSVFKTFNILRENRLKAQVRAEAFNAFNTTQFGRAGSTVGDASIGVISSVGVQPRAMQLALKFIF